MSASDIRAGKAFVALGIKDQLTKSLKGIGKQVEAFGRGVEAVGKKFAMLGGAVTAPMLAATASWAASGAELYRLSQRTGMSAEALSALNFAAEESGGSAEGMTAAVRKMNEALAEGERGSGEMINAFGQLGLSVQQLKSMSPEQQFATMANKISQIKDPAQQTAFAMKLFGRGAMDLMPLLKQGAAGLESYRHQAEEMGLIKNSETVKAAFDLDMAWKRAGGSLNTIKGAVASTLAPMLQRVAQWTTVIAAKVRDWVRANQPLIVTSFKVGATLLGVGSALAIVGKGISIVGGMFGTAATFVGLFSQVLGVVFSALGLLTSPVAILGTAIAGLGVYFLYSTGVMQKAIDWLGGTFGTLLKDAKDAFGAIADAIQAGDFSAAFKVAAAFMRFEWSKFTLWMRTEWESFKSWFFKSHPALAKSLINAFAAVGKFFSDMVGGILTVWSKATHAISSSIVDWAIKHPGSPGAQMIFGENPLESAGHSLKGKITTAEADYTKAVREGALAPEGSAEQAAARNRAEEALQRKQALLDRWSAARKADQSGDYSKRDELIRPELEELAGYAHTALDQEAKNFQEGVGTAMNARDEAIDKMKAQWQQNVDTGNAGGKARVDAAKAWVDQSKKEFDAAKAHAHAIGQAARNKHLDEMKKPELGGIDAMLGARSAISGTFSGAAAGLMGGAGGWQQRLLQHSRRQVDLLERANQLAEQQNALICVGP